MCAILTCTGIKYVLQNNLIPEEYIIKPLLLACFWKTPFKITSHPGPTGVTIASQFMVILRWFASLLCLEDQLP